ncbi:hypothetical protein J6590_083073 [Homalodisca vitripennis]|nr:hypothetical protein J6590_083073 [Homalodisca vitripennis]
MQQDIGTQRFDARILRWKQVGNTRAPAVAELSLTVLNMHGTKRTLSGPRETRHWQTRARDARITLAKRARVARILRWKQVGNPRAPAVAKLILTVLNMHRTRQTLSGPCATRHWQKRARDDWILRWKQVGNTRGPAVAELSLTVLNMHGTKRTLNGPRATRHWQTRARDARIVPRKQFSNTRTPAVADLSLRVLNMHGTMRTLSGPRATKHWHTTI